jgi:hypothetical protein
MRSASRATCPAEEAAKFSHSKCEYNSASFERKISIFCNKTRLASQHMALKPSDHEKAQDTVRRNASNHPSNRRWSLPPPFNPTQDPVLFQLKHPLRLRKLPITHHGFNAFASTILKEENLWRVPNPGRRLKTMRS